MKANSRNKSFQKLAAAAAFASLGLAGSAFAQQSPFYIGASIGSAQYDFNFNDQVQALAQPGLWVLDTHLRHDSDIGYKLTAGYQIIPQIAVELDYVGLGKATTSYQLVGLGRFPRDGTYKVSGINLSGVFSQPINEQFSVFGRIGMFYSKYQYSETGENHSNLFPSPEPPVHSFTAPDLKRSKLSYGLGMDYRMSAATSVRLGWDRYTDIGNLMADTETGNGKFDNIDLYSLSLLLRF